MRVGIGGAGEVLAIEQHLAMQKEASSFGRYQAARQVGIRHEQALLNRIAAGDSDAASDLHALRKSGSVFPATSTEGQIDYETKNPGFTANGNFSLAPNMQGADFHPISWHRSSNRIVQGLQNLQRDQIIQKPLVLPGRSRMSHHGSQAPSNGWTIFKARSSNPQLLPLQIGRGHSSRSAASHAGIHTYEPKTTSRGSKSSRRSTARSGIISTGRPSEGDSATGRSILSSSRSERICSDRLQTTQSARSTSLRTERSTASDNDRRSQSRGKDRKITALRSEIRELRRTKVMQRNLSQNRGCAKLR
jgi:hypothetical protein